jgi:hypothetical protein
VTHGKAFDGSLSQPVRLRDLILAVVICLAAACSAPAQRAVVPMLRGGPSDERPSWLR